MTISALPYPKFTGADIAARHDSIRGVLNALPAVVTEATGAAIQAAISAAQDHAGGNGGGEVWLPAGTYDLGGTGLTLPIGVGLRAHAGATLIYGGTGAALTIEGDASHGVRHLDLPNIERAGAIPGWFDGSDTTSLGIDLRGCMYDKVFVREVRGFATGLRVKAVDDTANGRVGNCVCNTIHLGQLINNKVGLAFSYDATSPSGANQNQVLGGVIRIDGAYRQAGCYYIHLPDGENNANLFLGVNLEDASGGVVALVCNSYSNTFLNCRFENAAVSGATKPIQFGPASAKNHLWGTMTVVTQDGPWTAIVDDQGGNNDYMSDGVLATKKLKIDYANGRLLLGDGTAAPAWRIAGYGTDRGQIGLSSGRGTRYWQSMWQEEVQQTSGTTIPTYTQHVALNYAGPATITGMAGGAPSDLQGLVTVFSVSGNVTLQHTAGPAVGAGKFVMKSGANVTPAAMTAVRFFLHDGNFYEI